VDSSGAVDSWQIILDNISPTGQCEQMVTRRLNDVVDISSTYSDSSCLLPSETSQGEIGGNAGTWKSVGIILPPCGVTIPGGISGGDCTPGSGNGSGSGGGSGNGNGAGNGNGSGNGVPEPSSVTLLAAGLLGGAFLLTLKRC